jgi:hypothetical protein
MPPTNHVRNQMSGAASPVDQPIEAPNLTKDKTLRGRSRPLTPVDIWIVSAYWGDLSKNNTRGRHSDER